MDKFNDCQAFNGIPKDYHFSLYQKDVGNGNGYFAVIYLDNGLNLRVVDDKGDGSVDGLDDVDILMDVNFSIDDIMDLFRSASP